MFRIKNAGILLGEDTAFQAVGEGSNPFTRSKLGRMAERLKAADC